jgi:hypothetical protein
MTYTRDLAAVFAHGAVLMGPFLKGRWGDQRMLGRAFRKLGVPILGTVDAPGYLEGGGVTLIGEDTAVASLCDRANEAGTRALRDLILGKEVKYFLEVPLPFGHIHVDGIFMVVDSALPDSRRLSHSSAGSTKPNSVETCSVWNSTNAIPIIPITEEKEKVTPECGCTHRSRSAIDSARQSGSRRNCENSEYSSTHFRKTSCFLETAAHIA